MTFPTPDQVREGRRAAWGTTPVAPAVDHEAQRTAMIAAGIAARRQHEAAAAADLARAETLIAGLWHRDVLPGHILVDLRSILHDLKTLFGPMVPPE